MPDPPPEGRSSDPTADPTAGSAADPNAGSAAGAPPDPTTDATRDATRRTILEAAGAATAAGAIATLFAGGAAGRAVTPESVADETGGAPEPTVRDAREVFPQSVASGGPTPSGVILWTRVDPERLRGEQPLWVEVARDPDFEDVVFSGREEVSTADDCTVRFDLDGELAADSFYHYRFVYDGAASPVGRCRTLPGPDADPDRLRLAVATCNNYLQGHFGAYSHVAREEVDFLVHLGDLIYENAGEGSHGRSIELPSGHGQAWTLADFRTLHRTYRSDRDMQRALERHTLVHTWDDHEVVNNRWWNYETDAPETESHPRGDDPEFMRQLHLRGITALTEYVPVRAQFDPDGDSLHEQFRLYRSLRFGDLAELFVTDERLYRTPPPEDEFGRRDFATPPSRAQDDPGRWILGEEQRRWFLDGVLEGDATWSLWGNEVLNAALKVVNAGEEAVYINYDAWDGYEHERLLMTGELADRGAENLVALTGDMHSYLAAYLKEDYKDASQSEHHTDEGRVGVELMTPAVSSDNLADSGLFPPARQEESFDRSARSQNPHIEWINSNNYGYSVVEVTDEELVYVAYAVPRTPDGGSAPKELLRAFRVPEGEVRLEEIEGDQLPAVDGSGAGAASDGAAADDD